MAVRADLGALHAVVAESSNETAYARPQPWATLPGTTSQRGQARARTLHAAMVERTDGLITTCTNIVGQAANVGAGSHQVTPNGEALGFGVAVGATLSRPG